jgi:hypothetical protein
MSSALHFYLRHLAPVPSSCLSWGTQVSATMAESRLPSPLGEWVALGLLTTGGLTSYAAYLGCATPALCLLWLSHD